MSDSNELTKIMQAEDERQGLMGTHPSLADYASAILNSRWAQRVRQREVERGQLRKAVEAALQLLDMPEKHLLEQERESSTSKEEALIRSIFSKPYMAIVKVQGDLSEALNRKEVVP